MSNFSYKDVYIEEGKRVLEVNILPEKYCNFDCIFCPIGRSKNKVDSQISFNEIDVDLNELDNKIEETKAELIFLTTFSTLPMYMLPVRLPESATLSDWQSSPINCEHIILFLTLVIIYFISIQSSFWQHIKLISIKLFMCPCSHTDYLSLRYRFL